MTTRKRHTGIRHQDVFEADPPNEEVETEEVGQNLCPECRYFSNQNCKAPGLFSFLKSVFGEDPVEGAGVIITLVRASHDLCGVSGKWWETVPGGGGDDDHPV